MPFVTREVSPHLLSFLRDHDLADYSIEVVKATQLWHLQDLLDTVEIEQDLSELTHHGMTKLQIRKLFQKLVRQKEDAPPKTPQRGDWPRMALAEGPAEGRVHLEERPLVVKRTVSLPPAIARADSLSSCGSLSTRSTWTRKAGAAAGDEFEKAVRTHLRSLRSKHREDHDFRDKTGRLETDYLEELSKPIAADELLNGTQSLFASSSSAQMDPGLVIYEMKLSLTNLPRVGHAVGQLYERRDKLVVSCDRCIHLAVVGSCQPGTDVHTLLSKFTEKFPDVLFFLTCFCIEAAYAKKPVEQIFSKPDSVVGDDSQWHSLQFRHTRPRSLSRTRNSKGSHALTILPPIAQKGSSDEHEAVSEIGPPQPDSKQEPDSAHEVAESDGHAAVQAGVNVPEPSTPHCNNDRGRCEAGELPAQQESSGDADAVQGGACMDAVAAVSVDAPQSELEHDKPPNAARFRPDVDSVRMQPSYLHKLKTAPAQPQSQRGRSSSRKPLTRAAMAKAGPVADDVEEFIRHHQLDDYAVKALRELDEGRQVKILARPYDLVNDMSSYVSCTIRKLQPVPTYKPSAQVEALLSKFHSQTDLRSRNSIRELPQHLQDEVLKSDIFERAGDLSGLLYSFCGKVKRTESAAKA
eukprot:TRINITY_DN51286_c0_g1_i1.p1 TRINITY_DN51286_c0_g1~~TRINITY_DN51286_c0_g1_i1.p1  ORF type:complete len:652 (+),score=75.16 TRINITY_DN51286_c0_g1_i1:53-1957(+)